MKKSTLLSMIVLAVIPAMVCAGNRSPSPEAAGVYFITPQDGDSVKSDFRVLFGLHDMGVAPAGADHANTGHHHLLIDIENLPPFDAPLPKSDQIRHYGGGQTETTLNLPPGKHTLQLLLGNFLHIPHDPVVISKKITITVTE